MSSKLLSVQLTSALRHREQRAAVQRYEAWQKLRDIAVKNAGGKLPEGYKDIPHPPPPPPPQAEGPPQDQGTGNRPLSTSKRAEQNRKAQRAFRERRDQ